MRKQTQAQTQKRYLKVTDMDMMIHPIIARVLMANGAMPGAQYYLIPEDHSDISFFLISLQEPEWVTPGFEDHEIHTVLGK